MTELPLSVRFARRALAPGPVPNHDQVIERARLLLADFVACSMRGSRQPSTRFAGGAVGASGAEASALLAGLSAHGLELDDVHEASSHHPGTVVWPTVLSLAAFGSQSCETTLQAAVAGYDAMCTLGVLGGAKETYARGFHPTGVYGVVGSTVAAALMLGLDEAQLVSALGIAASLAGGTLAFLDDGGWTKRLHAGLAAAHGIRAAELALRGFRGPERSLDGRFGMLWAFAGKDGESAAQTPLPHAGSGVAETSFKLYPCCRYIHGTIDLLLAIGADEHLDPAAIERVECGVLSAGFALVAAPAEEKVAVHNEVEAQFSLPYAAALALTHGAANLEDFQRAPEFAPSLRPLMERVECVRSATLDEAFPEQWGAAVRVELSDGRHIERRAPHTRGSPASPVGWPEIEKKMSGLVGAEDSVALAQACRQFSGDGPARHSVPVQFTRRAALDAARQ